MSLNIKRSKRYYRQKIDLPSHDNLSLLRLEDFIAKPRWILQAGGFQKLRHSLGLVSTSAAASIMGTQAKSWKFVDAVWNAKLEPYSDGYFDPYYDGLLYLFSLMHLSGNYQIITPGMK